MASSNNKVNATVIYDTERSPSSQTSSLAPPSDIDTLLRSKRSSSRFFPSVPPSLQRALTCLSISLSALQANGVYCWGTYGPVVERMLELNGTETQTIVVGGILGVYLMAAPLGSFTDRYGPRAGSLLSAVLGGTGYLTFASILKSATPDTPNVYLYLTAAFFLVGAATVGSYFACLTCATLSFPSYPTLSLSLPLSLVGLSALVLSSFSILSTFHRSSELDPIRFLTFLGILSPCINIFGFIAMKVLPSTHTTLPGHEQHDQHEENEEEEEEPIDRLLHLDEHTPLLIGGLEAAREQVEAQENGKISGGIGTSTEWTVKKMLLDWEGFWAFGFLLALVTGPGEMIIASIGSILTSLLPPGQMKALSFLVSSSFLPISISSKSLKTLTTAPATMANPDSLMLRNKHVYLISISSTLSRLITGFLADHLAPPQTAIPNPAHRTDHTAPTHIFVQKKKVKLHRSAFAAICSIILSGIFAWNAGLLQTEKGLWVLSCGVGSMYGALFTLTPAIVSHHFGPTNFGLAWGMVSYFAAVGSVAYSYLYAIISSTIAAQSIPSPPHDFDMMTNKKSKIVETCYGSKCFSTTFWVCSISCLVGGLVLVLLGRRWKV